MIESAASVCCPEPTSMPDPRYSWPCAALTFGSSIGRAWSLNASRLVSAVAAPPRSEACSSAPKPTARKGESSAAAVAAIWRPSQPVAMLFWPGVPRSI